MTIRRLDGIFQKHGRPNDRTFLKIDAPGFEKSILNGAGAMLEAALVELECSLAPLYAGARA